MVCFNDVRRKSVWKLKRKMPRNWIKRKNWFVFVTFICYVWSVCSCFYDGCILLSVCVLLGHLCGTQVSCEIFSSIFWSYWSKILLYCIVLYKKFLMKLIMWFDLKQAQKRLELFLAREQRRPVEDMSIHDAKVYMNYCIIYIQLLFNWLYLCWV